MVLMEDIWCLLQGEKAGRFGLVEAGAGQNDPKWSLCLPKKDTVTE